MDTNNEPSPSKPASPVLLWILALVATVVIIGVIGFFLLWSQAERERDAEYRSGWDYAGASYVLKMHPNEPSSHSAMASVWMKQRRYDKAVAEYKQTVKLEPRSPYNHLDLGNALDSLGQTASAKKEWRAAVNLDVPGGQAATNATRQLAPDRLPLPSPRSSH